MKIKKYFNNLKRWILKIDIVNINTCEDENNYGEIIYLIFNKFKITRKFDGFEMKDNQITFTKQLPNDTQVCVLYAANKEDDPISENNQEKDFSDLFVNKKTTWLEILNSMYNNIEIMLKEKEKYLKKECPSCWGIDCCVKCNFEKCWNRRFVELIEDIDKYLLSPNDQKEEK